MSDTKREWAEMLRWMLDDYRQKHPGDVRNDAELAESLMEHFHQSGLVDKENDKYLLPTIVDDVIDREQ